MVVATTSVVALFLIVISFVLGMLVGSCRSKVSPTVSAAEISEESTQAISEMAAGVKLERPHEYEDIVLGPRDVDTYMNDAYGL